MKADKRIFLLKIALVAIALIIFANQLGQRDALNLAGVLATIPLVFALDFVEFLLKRKVSHAIEVAYLLFVFLAAIVGCSLMVYDLGPIYDKVIHFAAGVLTIFMAREFFGKYISGLHPFIKFLFYVGIVAIMALSWEIYEFSIDQIFGTDMQRTIQWGVSDTMLDLIAALGGGILTWLLLWWRKAKV